MAAKKLEMIEALRQFAEAHKKIVELWNGDEAVELNDTNAIDLYPFEQSFDDYAISDWVETTIEELEDKVKACKCYFFDCAGEKTTQNFKFSEDAEVFAKEHGLEFWHETTVELTREEFDNLWEATK